MTRPLSTRCSRAAEPSRSRPLLARALWFCIPRPWLAVLRSKTALRGAKRCGRALDSQAGCPDDNHEDQLRTNRPSSKSAGGLRNGAPAE
eukprot:8022395-Pyramimonas_sp.AAC.1